MHPEHLHMLAKQRVVDAERFHRRRLGVTKRARPPGRVRGHLAAMLVRLATRLTDAPGVELHRRA